jgi:mRNA interferase RelE/StbE
VAGNPSAALTLRHQPSSNAAPGAVSDDLTGDSHQLRTTSTVRRALSETLPEAVEAAAYQFITGPLLTDPHRTGKRLLPPMDDRFSARRGTYRVIYRIDDKARVVTAVDVATAATLTAREPTGPGRLRLAATPQHHQPRPVSTVRTRGRFSTKISTKPAATSRPHAPETLAGPGTQAPLFAPGGSFFQAGHAGSGRTHLQRQPIHPAGQRSGRCMSFTPSRYRGRSSRSRREPP